MFCAIAFSVLLSGCAGIVGSNMQSVSVQTREKTGLDIIGATCEVANDNGKWAVLAPGNLTIQESNKNLKVTCNKKGLEPGKVSVVSDIKGAFWGNTPDIDPLVKLLPADISLQSSLAATVG